MSAVQAALTAVLGLCSFSDTGSTISSQLTGVLDDCFCDIESIDDFNSYKIFPKLQQLLERDYFRYYKVRYSTYFKFIQ
ncbi:hypothetical protein scyTo_0020597 [Scyliorhinus torazame]|uniref:Uncharacterized protein n=1 Tax=Scyliorhinus torazame TaxID=75743 RepID=A0A401PX18_SCYTO|nr:hypothetical protein [Scyliorhinus torazame]